MDKDLALLHDKIDYLTEQLEEQRKRLQAFDELKKDLLPIANHMVKLSIEELAEIGTEFQLEDLLFLFKRLLRNTNLLLSMMDRLESLLALSDDAQLLGKQVLPTRSRRWIAWSDRATSPLRARDGISWSGLSPSSTRRTCARWVRTSSLF